MAEGILGLGTGQSTSLNQELINKLKGAERKAQVEPLEKRLEDITSEREIFSEIDTTVNELLGAVKPLDLFVSGGTTVFDEKVANTSGTSATFDAVDVSKLNNGVTTVDIQTLAQKDAYQSNAVNEASKDSLGDIGTLNIDVGADSFSFDTANYATYDELATAINNKAGVTASMDQVGTDSYRLVLKSESQGLENALNISGTASQALGYTIDGTTVNAANQTLTAQDMTAKVDGVDYTVSSNTLEVDGLSITANSIGTSTININDDSSLIQPQIQEFIDKYNAAVDKIGEELGNADTPIGDKSSLRNIMSQLKDDVLGQYGAAGDKSIFNYGFELDKEGKLSLDSAKFSEAVANKPDELRELFIGTADSEGLGTKLKSTIDDMSFTGGVIKNYENGIDTREEGLKEEKEEAVKKLDDKYQQLANQFASYTSLITQFESSFSGLQMMIQQSKSSD
ncbi:MAG: flagellar filament capping protein FliD [Campylobacterota bacterium]